MNMKILKNEGGNIVDFPIAEPDLSSGDVKYDDNGNIKGTGQTLLWSIGEGETKAFPEYVAKELLRTYTQTDPIAKHQFLVEVEGETEKAEESKPVEGGLIICKYCGQGFKNGKAIGLHMGIKHLKEL